MTQTFDFELDNLLCFLAKVLIG